jgi:hypothetical protein
MDGWMDDVDVDVVVVDDDDDGGGGGNDHHHDGERADAHDGDDNDAGGWE